MQDDVPSVDPIDISLNQLDLNEVSAVCSSHQFRLVSIIAFLKQITFVLIVLVFLQLVAMILFSVS